MGLKWTQKMTFLTEKNFGKMNFVKDLCEKKMKITNIYQKFYKE